MAQATEVAKLSQSMCHSIGSECIPEVLECGHSRKGEKSALPADWGVEAGREEGLAALGGASFFCLERGGEKALPHSMTSVPSLQLVTCSPITKY